MNTVVYQGEVDVLIAIDNVRKELAEASRRDADLTEMREIHGRLVSLYAVLNIDNILVIIDQIDYKRSA
jgi:hypothetical protein